MNMDTNLFMVICFSISLAGCASINPSPSIPIDPINTYRIDVSSRENGKITHYSTADLKQKKIGVLTTENTKRTFDYLERTKEKNIEWKNYGYGSDIDVTYLTKIIDARLKKAFLDIRYVDSIEGVYDYWIYLDITSIIGERSNHETSVDVKLIFVNNKNEYMGQIEANGIDLVAYPYYLSAGFTSAVKKMSEYLDAQLEGGVDLIK